MCHKGKRVNSLSGQPPEIHDHRKLKLAITFSYGRPAELLVAAATVLIGAGLAAVYMRAREPLPVRLLRAVHTGSVNDYAALATAGLLTAVLVLLG